VQWVNFTDEEARAIVDETHRLGRKVAAHAIGSDGIAAALRAGADTIEHGDGLTDELMDEMIRKNVYWVPTVFVGVHVAPGRGGVWPRLVEAEKAAFGRGVKKGVKIAFGTDAGGFDWTKFNQAVEIKHYVDYGMTPMGHPLGDFHRGRVARLAGPPRHRGSGQAGRPGRRLRQPA
jgi:imidazolonepropionase-like amidohydrolase